MSGEKTEQPTQKKLEDSAEKGQSYKSHDAVVASIIFAGVLGLPLISLGEIGALFKDFIKQGSEISTVYVVDRVVRVFLELSIPFVSLCIVATIIPSLIQSKCVLAFEAIKFDLDSLNPVNGFKKIFSMKTVKELVKALLYLAIFTQVIIAFFSHYQLTLLSLVNVQTSVIARIWVSTGSTIVLLCLLAFAAIIFFDGLIDYYLYIKDLKMEKHEVKQEYKEQEGNAEVKSRRRELHQELLSAQEQNDIDQSNFILANPTHLAIGIYANTEVVPIPFVSLMAKGPKALAIIRYAERHGTPVVRDKVVARRLFPLVRRYSFIPVDFVEPIFLILSWLKEVEQAHAAEANPQPQDAPPPTPQTVAATPPPEQTLPPEAPQ